MFFQAILTVAIDEALIKNAVLQTKGAGGPSHLDADQYRHMLLSHNYKKEAKDLRDQIAILARKLAKQIIDPTSIESLIACRLIPLNKNPGVRPIGIGEILRRIIGKTIGWFLKSDIQEAARTFTNINRPERRCGSSYPRYERSVR